MAQIVKETIKEINYKFLARKNIFVSIALVAPKEIRKLNRIYRKKDGVTDILSFAEYKNIQAIKRAVDNPPTGGLFLGELILCYDDIREYSRKKNIGLEKELANVVSHGLLHLLGFEHGEEMFGIQEKVRLVK